ncbi:MAG: alpha-amylase family glycosyl hydrolase, partial [Natronospirillum sp.]
MWSTTAPQAWVRITPDNEELLVPMTVCDSLPGGYVMLARIALDAVRPHTAYVFKVQLAPGVMRWLSADGEHARSPGQQVHFKWVHEAPPTWVKEQVFYQVFPDRFRCGDSSLNVADGAYHYLGERPVRAREWSDEPQAADGANEFFHGDLPGVIEALPYLQDTLGVTALYLNPVFRSDSNHKYDTIDFKQVDVTLGGDQALVDLRAETEQRGMRLLLDGVLNHTSVLHEWFVRAQTGEVPFKDFYMIADDGSYVSWKGHASLPVLDYGSTEVVDRCYAADDSILRHWLRPPYAIDGWRLDVIHMLGEG